MDDAGGVDPHEHLAFTGMRLGRLLVGKRLGATASVQTDRLHVPLPTPVGRTPKLSNGRAG